MELIYAVIILATLGVGLLLGRIIARYENMIENMKRGLEDQSKRLEELEKTARKSRNPYLTNVGLEDAIALALDLEKTVEYASLRNRYLKDILRKIRTDPGSYDEDRPNGKREIGDL